MAKSAKQAIKRTKVESAGDADKTGAPPTAPDQIMKMPMTNYLSAVGMHTSLLIFSAIYMPQSSLLQELPFAYENGPGSVVPTPMEALTARPAFTLFTLCLGTLLLQLWWSNWLRNWWIDSMLEDKEDAKKQAKTPFSKQRAKALVRVLTAVVVASIALHGVLILFGAPATTHIGKTYMLAFFIATLTVLPPTYLYGPPSFASDSTSLYKRWTFVRLFAEFSPRNPIERALSYPAAGTVVGAWIGVIPIALDWERPWQAWPLTPACGALLGYIVASIAALTVNALELVTTQLPAN